MADIVKQVIIINLKAPMSLGRLMAQAAHASVLNILSRGGWENDIFILNVQDFALRWWMKKQFTKVVCKAWGNDQMLEIKTEAEEKGIYVSVMEEEGFITALALGPAEIKDLKFTKTLALM